MSYVELGILAFTLWAGIRFGTRARTVGRDPLRWAILGVVLGLVTAFGLGTIVNVLGGVIPLPGAQEAAFIAAAAAAIELCEVGARRFLVPASAALPSPGGETPEPSLPARLRWKTAIRDVIIVQVLASIGGVLTLITHVGADDDVPILPLIGTALGFAIVAFLLRAPYFRHFLAVFVGNWLVVAVLKLPAALSLGRPDALTFPIPLLAVQALVGLAVGIQASILFRRKADASIRS